MSTSPSDFPRAFEADYFDGRSSARHAVRVEVQEGIVRIRGPGVALDVARGEVAVSPRLGKTPIRIALPGGGLLVTPDYERVAGLLGVRASRSLAHRLESRPAIVLASLAGVAVAVGLAYAYGIPWAAREVAERLPPGVESQLSEEGLKGMDRVVLRPTGIEPERQARLREIFAGLSKTSNVPARMEFRDGQWIGANAFAIPGGILVVTDQLLELFADDERVAAVLAHELGHVRHRHTTRHILQDSMVALLATAVLGDVSAVAGLATTVPTVLLHTGYSRDFEREADRFAFDLLKKTGRSPRLLGDALTQLEAQAGKGRDDECRVPRENDADKEAARERPPRPRAADLGYLSTHPATAERVQAAEDAARQ